MIYSSLLRTVSPRAILSSTAKPVVSFCTPASRYFSSNEPSEKAGEAPATGDDSPPAGDSVPPVGNTVPAKGADDAVQPTGQMASPKGIDIDVTTTVTMPNPFEGSVRPVRRFDWLDLAAPKVVRTVAQRFGDCPTQSSTECKLAQDTEFNIRQANVGLVEMPAFHAILSGFILKPAKASESLASLKPTIVSEEDRLITMRLDVLESMTKDSFAWAEQGIAQIEMYNKGGLNKYLVTGRQSIDWDAHITGFGRFRADQEHLIVEQTERLSAERPLLGDFVSAQRQVYGTPGINNSLCDLGVTEGEYGINLGKEFYKMRVAFRPQRNVTPTNPATVLKSGDMVVHLFKLISHEPASNIARKILNFASMQEALWSTYEKQVKNGLVLAQRRKEARARRAQEVKEMIAADCAGPASIHVHVEVAVNIDM